MESDLPFVDEHQILISASAAEVWHSLIVRIPGFGAGEAFARVLGAKPGRASGGAIVEGATLPGFEVAEVVPGQRLRLAGRHRFSRYELILTLETQPGGTMLSARTNAVFPGLHGRLYRVLVISSRAHQFLVERLLRDIRRLAEGA